MRQLAWLNTAPVDRSKASKGSAPEPVTRIRRMRADGIEPVMPPLPTPWIVERLLDMGPTVPGGMGAAPLPYSEIEAWQRCSGVELQPWEARLLRRLSGDYLAECQRAETPDCPAPWTAEDAIERNRAAVARKVGNAFKAYIQGTQKGRA